MKIEDAKKLIQTNLINATQRWADLGCGSGLFSRALLQNLNNQSEVFAVDVQTVSFSEKNIHFHQLNFEKDALPFSSLDGILMANSFHYINNKLSLLQKLEKHLLPKAVFLLIEYDMNIANRWVPYPLSVSAARDLFAKAGFSFFEKINEHPSVYQRAKIYSALIKKEQ